MTAERSFFLKIGDVEMTVFSDVMSLARVGVGVTAWLHHWSIDKLMQTDQL